MLTPSVRMHVPRRQGGFSLTEMLVALVAGLIVVGSVLAFTVAMANSTGKNVQATRLDQELRTAMSMMTREIRRAGYYRKNYDTIGANSFVQSYAGVCLASGLAACTNGDTDLDNDCLVMAYDKFVSGDTTTAPIATEYKGFRRRVVGGVGVVEVNLADAPPSCAATGSNWLTLTNPSTVNITSLLFTYVPNVVQAAIATDGSAINVTVRTVKIAITGSVLSDSTVTRTFEEIVRVRTDLVSNP